MHMMVNVSSVSFFTSTTYFNLVTYDCVPFGFRIKCFNLICIAQCAKEKNFCDVPLIRCKNNGPQMMTLTLNYPSYRSKQTQKNNTPKNSNQRNKTAYIRRSQNFSRDGGRLGSEEYFVRPRSRIGVGNGI